MKRTSPPHHLKWDSILENGILMLGENDNEAKIRDLVQESLREKYPIFGANDFVFVKVRHKQITNMQLGPSTEYSYQVIKKMAGQGLLYIQVKPGYEFLYEKTGQGFEEETTVEEAAENQSSEQPNVHTSTYQETPENSRQVTTLPEKLVEQINDRNMSDPVEILRFLQNNLVKGRLLDIQALDEDISGETNYICVDRCNILGSTFTELQSVQDYAITFEVDFIGEMAKDFGGPRKEWIRLMNIAIKQRHFDHGLREYLADEYVYVGIMIGVALLQSGQLPTYIPSDILGKILEKTDDSCIANIQKGLNEFGLLHIFKAIPILLHLLHPSDVQLTAKMLLKMLTTKVCS